MKHRGSIFLCAAFCLLAAPCSASTPEDLFTLIHNGDDAGLSQAIRAGADVNELDSHRTAPLHFAATYGNTNAMRILLDAGADPNLKNGQDATALILSGGDEAKTKLLLGKGADVNVCSKMGRTPLIVAAARPGADIVVRLLIARGADVKAAPGFGDTALHGAAAGLSIDTIGLLLEKGADVNAATQGGDTPLMEAVIANRLEVVKLLLSKGANVNVATLGGGKVKHGDLALKQLTPLMFAAPFGAPEMIRTLLAAGAKVNARDVRGMVPLMLAVSSDNQDPRVVKILVEAGADINVKSSAGETALDWARKFNNPKLIATLESSGAVGTTVPEAPVRGTGNPPKSPGIAVEQAVALLSGSNTEYFNQSGCFGCHHQGLSSLIRDSAIAKAQADGVTAMRPAEARFTQFAGTGGGVDTASALVLGSSEAGVPSGSFLEAVAGYIAANQQPNGSWHEGGVSRAPIEESDIVRTVHCLRALQAYAWPARHAEFNQRVILAAAWLRSVKPQTNYERAELLLGLHWADAGQKAIRRAGATLLAEQRPDGGWSQTKYLSSDAYATGLALRALQESGVLHQSAPAYRRAVDFLLRTQLDDGSWYVRSRAPKFQPYFQSGFPHEHDQWISAAATALAASSLIRADACSSAANTERCRSWSSKTSSAAPGCCAGTTLGKAGLQSLRGIQ